MQLRIGLITESEITTNREGEDNVRLLQVEITDSEDIQTVEQIRGSGDNQNPQNDTAVVVADLGPAWKIAVGIDDGVEPEDIEKGERIIYSYDANRVIMAFIKFLVDGTIHINGEDDNAVRFSELKTAFDQLKSDHDDLANIMNLHTHTSGGSGAPTTKPITPPPEYSPATPGLPGVLPSVADIDPAKVDDVKLTGYVVP